MFGRSFYHGTIRKYVIVFGNMFNGIQIQRFNSNNERIQTLAVPIAYGPKEKFLVRLGQDPNLDQDIAISLPRIGFEMQALTYASNRKLQSTIKNVKINNDDNKRLSTQFMPVPYDITFLMSIFVKNADDGTQILEQILPYFQPEWTNSIKLMPEMDLTYDVPCILNDVTLEDTYEGSFDTRRALIWNLNFTMKGYIFGPVSTTGIIRRAETTFNAAIDLQDIDNVDGLEKAVARPAMTVDRKPTSNSAISVDPDTINADDPFGIATDITDIN